MSEAGHIEIQNILYRYLSNNYNPSTKEIQQGYYGEHYNQDSRIQYETIYQSIVKGRKTAITRLYKDIETDTFENEIRRILHEQAKECEEIMQTDNYKMFWDDVIDGKFGKEVQKDSEEFINEIPLFAVWFKEKTWIYAKEGANLIITAGNPFKKEAVRWYIPSWFAWNRRERKLYARTLKIFRRQLTRGIQTRVALPSGIPIQKVLTQETVIRASLMNSTSWICTRCGARNLNENEVCAICNTQKP